MGYICENRDNCEEYLPKIIVRHKQKKSVAAYRHNGDLFSVKLLSPLIKDGVEAFVDACTQCAELVDFCSVLAAHEVA